MVLTIFLFMALVCTDLFLLGSSMPGISNPVSTNPADNPSNVDTNQLEIGGKVYNLDWDWLVNLANTNESVDITRKAFRLDFVSVPEVPTTLSILLEANTATNDANQSNENLFSAEVPVIRASESMLIVPSIYFPSPALSNGVRMVIQIQAPVHLNNVVMVDAPPASEIKLHRFNFQYWKLKQAIVDLQKENDDFTMDVGLTSDLFDEAFKQIMFGRVDQLMNRLNVIVHESNPDSTASVRNTKLELDGDNPCARMIFALFQEFRNPLLGLLAKSKGNFRFVGRVIGIAIANRVRFDGVFSSMILKMILSQQVRHGLGRRFDAQMNSLCQGVWDVIPPELLEPFDEEELSWILSGHPE